MKPCRHDPLSPLTKTKLIYKTLTNSATLSQKDPANLSLNEAESYLASPYNQIWIRVACDILLESYFSLVSKEKYGSWIRVL